MKVLADLHHEALYQSLRLLFEKRLGGTVLRPVGMDWYEEGFWGYPTPTPRETAGQQLGGGYRHEGITLREFCQTPWFDLAIASTPDQWYRWVAKFREHGIKIPLAFQSGNYWQLPPCKNLLNSTTLEPPPGCNAVRYHQEFSLIDYYPPSEKPGRVIASFMHNNPRSGYFLALEREMPDWIFREYGAGGRDGQPADLAWAMRNTRYLFHAKEIEGYGFNQHYAAACGVPIFAKVRQNSSMMIGALYEPGVTCLDLDEYVSPGHLADAIRRFDKDHAQHSRAIYERFREVVSFDREEIAIRKWLERLVP